VRRARPRAPARARAVAPRDETATSRAAAPADLDYAYVASCTSAPELLSLLRELQSGRQGKYVDLEAAIEARLLAVMSPADARRYAALKGPTPVEEGAARDDVAAWLAATAARAGAARAPPAAPVARA